MGLVGCSWKVPILRYRYGATSDGSADGWHLTEMS